MATQARQLVAQADSALRPEWRAGETKLPVARYADPAFAALEGEKLWPHVWQMACRLDQIAEPGQFTVYDIADQSIIVVRVDEAMVKAFHNVCPHRATALAVGSGKFDASAIVCPFHGWAWNLGGDITSIPTREEFAGSDKCFGLREVRSAIWMGGVWINMDPDAPELAEQMAPIADLIDPLLFDQMKFHWHKSIEVEANWKIAQEAFVEAYHVLQTHPQLANPKLGGIGLPYYAYSTHANGHGSYAVQGAPALMGINRDMGQTLSQDEQVDGLVSGLTGFWLTLLAMVTEEDIAIARTMRHHELAPGEAVFDAFHKVLRDHYGAQGRPIPERSALEKVTNMFVFPNITFLPMFGNVLMYRSRPTKDNDPNRCIFEIFSLRTYAEGENPPKWETEDCTDALDPGQYPLIPRQDFGNIVRQQQGMHSRGLDAVTLSCRQETTILNMHHEMDRYLEQVD